MPEIPSQAVQAASTPAAVIVQYEHERFCQGRAPDDLGEPQDRKRHERDAGRLLAALAEHGYRFWREVTPEEEQADTDAWPDSTTEPPAPDAPARASTPPYAPLTADPGVVGSADDPISLETPTALREAIADRLLAEDARSWGYGMFEGSRNTALAVADVMLSVGDDELERAQDLARKRGGHALLIGQALDLSQAKLGHAEAAVARVRERLDALIADGFGATTPTLRDLRDLLDVPADGEQTGGGRA
jgi:hypothetical protein